MKFAKVFQQALEEDHVPPEWVDRAIKYKALKKRIGKVVQELEAVGIVLDEDTMEYKISLEDECVRPQLQVSISPLLRGIIEEKLVELGYHFDIKPLGRVTAVRSVDDLHSSSPKTDGGESLDDAGDSGSLVEAPIDTSSGSVPIAHEAISVHSVASSAASTVSAFSAVNPFDPEPFYLLTITLVQDAKFFQILYSEIEGLNEFRAQIEEDITNNVQTMARAISMLSSPNVKKSDMYLWRQLFQMYIESEIFFSTTQRHTGYVDIALSKEKYAKFLQNVAKTNLVAQFKKRDSQTAFMDFKRMNEEILKVSNYQSFNTMAVTKILKKFDKQTHLHSKDVFPDILQNSPLNILNGSIARDVCAIISQNLLSIVPQIDDYLCPICFSIAFKPIRLRCGHLFCLRCLVKLRRKNEDKCPLCRDENLLSLTTEALDVGQMNYMKTYFPVEVRQKEKENNKEIIKETYGSDPDAPCVIV